MIVYRPGAITLEQIRAIAGPAEFFAETKALATAPREGLPSPGVGLRHYAPKARLIPVYAVESAYDFRCQWEQIARDHYGEHFGIMLPTEWLVEELRGHLDTICDPYGKPASTFDWGNWPEPEQLAQRLFAGLRHLDSLGCTMIFCPVPQGDGIAAAIRDRIRKAASSPNQLAQGASLI